MSKKIKSPLAGKSRHTLRVMRSIVHHYVDWRNDYLAGRTTDGITPFELFTIGPGSHMLEAEVGHTMEYRTQHWLKRHDSKELREANRLNRLPRKERHIEEMHSAITAFLAQSSPKTAN